MTEKELIGKLNNLKKIKPDDRWKTSQRGILLSQVQNTGAASLSTWQGFWIVTKSVFSAVPQTAYFSLAIIIFLASGLWFGRSLPFSPDSSLYIAKTISEKAYLNFIFDESQKTQLVRQYAQEHAQEIANTLNDPEFNQADTNAVDKLNASFKEEIGRLKSSLPKKEEEVVISADSGKDATGVSVYDPQTEEVRSETSTIVPVVEKKDPNQILDEAQKLFDEKNYQGAADKLEEAKTAIK